MGEAKGKPLTLEQLAERWDCSTETVLDRVRTRGVPFVWLGRGEPRLTAAGRRLLVFRPADIDRWEEGAVRVWKPDGPGAAPEPKPAPIRGWDGVSRLGGQRARRKARSS